MAKEETKAGVIMMTSNEKYIAIAPGMTIKEMIDDRGMTQRELAMRMDMSQKHISKLINGEVALTPEVAERLESVLGTPASFWNNLEAKYQEILTKIRQENSLEDETELARNIPYAKMAKRGWVPETRSLAEKILNLRKFFEVANLNLILKEPALNSAVWRKTIRDGKKMLASLCWAQQVRRSARNIEVGKLDINGLREAIPNLKAMTTLPQERFESELKQQLASRGIALVLLGHIEGSTINGVTFKDGGKTIIGITSRGKYADQFWFSLFHEIGHVIANDYDQEGNESIENKADQFAQNSLIPDEYISLFIQRQKGKTVSANSIRSFAEFAGVSPGIIVGRLQNEGAIAHSQHNDLRDRVTFS